MIEKTYETPGPLTLDLTIPQGTIDVDTVEGDRTHVVLDCDDEKALEDARVELRGDELVVEVERKGLLGGMINIQIGDFALGGREYRLRITTPPGATLRLKSAAADVTARGTYASVDMKTASGDATIGDVAGDLTIKSVSGDVEVAHVGGRTSAQLVSGDLHLRDAESSVTVKSVSGDLRLRVAAGDVALTSVSGDIEVGVRRGSRVHVDANSVSGGLDSELELADSPAAGDGPTVDLRAKTVSGDFRVVRA